MVYLTDLPNELLEEILLLATNGDQECLREVKWRRECESEVALLALHLLRNPNHRPLVRTLEFNSLSTLYSVGRVPPWSLIAARVGLRPETLAELAEAADRTFPPDLASDWSYRIRNGCADAIAALILAWSTRVTEVEFALSPLTREDDGLDPSDDEVYQSDDEFALTPPNREDDDMEHLNGMIMQFIDWAAHNVSTKQNEDLPLSQVQHLRMRTWMNGHGETEVASSAFQLPKLRILETLGLKISRDESPIFPERGLTIEKLYLKDFEITGNGIWHIIGGCRQLRVLNIDLNNSPNFFGSKTQMSNAIIRQAASINEIHLKLHKWGVRWDDTQFLSDYEVPLDRCFARLSQLHTLTVDVKELLPSSEGPITPDFLVTRLPVSIRELTINWYTAEMGSSLETIAIGTGEVDIWLGIVEALKVLLREARPGYKFSNLRYVDASEILFGSDELQKVVEIGESNGVHVEDF
ncbi:hypothetical protein FPSE_03462 [Fusarium pseudograminearum CS3096]|uniref:F-box domain-containing protein n=1 Tax=Fusarium pseudograminearum (strain CS3096) TaxID=1028729 RepID=K3VNG7_FUSPC|nr:hypothetical protein FPSE_03462 [Fusarium pseudograminearum CS3096]EKJ76379.1 hypothetical protein FPSE_03462 [Fusarium pseudograminearum CS3096]